MADDKIPPYQTIFSTLHNNLITLQVLTIILLFYPWSGHHASIVLIKAVPYDGGSHRSTQDQEEGT